MSRGAINNAAPLDTLDNNGVSNGDDVTWTIPAAVVQSWIDSPAANAGLMITKTANVGSHFYLSGIDGPMAPTLSFELGAAAPAVPEPAGLGLVGLALLAVRRRRS